MAAEMGLRPSPLLALTVVLLCGSVAAFVGPPEMHMLGDPTISNRLKLSPESPPFLIRSPFYSYFLYSNGDYSSMVLESGPDPLVLTFKFRYFQVEKSENCVFDYLCLHGVKFCGHDKNGTNISFILPENSQTTVLFRSDWDKVCKGFDLLVTTEPASNTTQVSEPRGSGHSVEAMYLKDVTYSPDMPYNDSCSYITKVYELCHPYMIYHMNTSLGLPDPSFYSVRLDATSRPFIIQSPYWLKKLDISSQKCSVVLQSGPEPLILSFNYSIFSLESSQNCRHRYLCVNGVNFCGRWSNNIVHDNILPANNNLTIYFPTDKNNKAVIEITVTPRRAVDKEMVTEVIGFIAKHNTPLEKQHTFSAEMPYEDRCPATNRYELHTLCYTHESHVVRLSPTSQPSIILSPNYGIGKHSSNCFLVLETGHQPVIVIFHFQKIKIRAEKKCPLESLCIHGTTYCGDWPTGRKSAHILPENSTSTIIFKTHLAPELTDFEIHMTTMPISTPMSLIEQRGVANEIHELSFVNVTYTPGMPYIDLCSITENNIPYVLCQPDQSDTLTLSSRSHPLVILSPNYGNDNYYGSCILALNSQHDPLILKFNFKKFQLKNTSSCAVDSICIHGVTFCNKWMTGRQFSYILPPNSRSTVVLNTEVPRDVSGFEIHMTTELAKETKAVSEPGGYGESESRFLLHPANYIPDKHYIDFCSIQHGYTLCGTNKSNVVKLSHTSELFFIRSPPNGIAGDQEGNVCSLVLESGQKPLVLTYYFRTIQLGIPDSCSNNSLCIHGVSFCNNLMSGREVSYILPEHRNSTIYFQTIGGGDRSDFDIYVRVQVAAVKQQVSEPRSMRTSDGHFSLRSVTYLPGMPYVDFCEVNNRTIDKHYLNSQSKLVEVNPQSPPFYIYSHNDSSDNYTSGAYHSLTLEAGAEPLVVTVYFGQFNVENDDNCAYDSLCIHGVKFCGAEGLLNGQLISHILPENETSTFLFTSDFSVVKRGFVIQVSVERADNSTRVREGTGIWNDERGPDFKVVTYSPGIAYNDTCKDTQEVYEICHPTAQNVTVQASTRPFIIRSPDWGKRGNASNRSCSLTLVNGPDLLFMLFEYRYLSLKTSRNCSHDYLCVNGVRFCGKWTKPESTENFLREGNTLTINYKTNDDFKKPGFEIIVTPRLAANRTVLSEVIAYTPGNHTLLEERFEHSSELPYEDRCLASRERTQVYIMCHLNGSNVLKVGPDTERFIVLSPNYDLHDNSQPRNCSLVLESGHEPLIVTFHMVRFRLSPRHVISNDFLCVDYVSFLGEWVHNSEFDQILPENRRSTIFFRSFDSDNFPDFEVRVSTKLATEGRSIWEPRGQGYDKHVFYYRNVTYFLGMPYMDACAITTTRHVELFHNKTQVVQLRPKSPMFFINSPTWHPTWNYALINSSLVLESGRDPLIVTFYLKLFHVKYGVSCSHNSLCIHGFKLCGDNKGQLISQILPENSKSTIVFKLQVPQSLGPNEIMMQVAPADNKTLVKEQRGFGNGGSESMNDDYDDYDDYHREHKNDGNADSERTFENVNYSPDMYYADLCADNPVTRTYELCYHTNNMALRISASSRPFLVHSPNWKNSGTYGNYRRCSLSLTAGNEPLVLTVNYRKFLLESSAACTNDYLCANRVRLCGYLSTPRVLTHILPENGIFTFFFHTNSKHTRTGFEIHVAPRRIVDNEVVSEVTHYDPMKWKFEFRNVSYHPGMLYENTCDVLQQSSTTKRQPTTSTLLPTTPTIVPTTSTKLPTTPTKVPTTSTKLPTTPIEVPTTPTKLPTTPIEVPTTPTKVPTTST